MERVVAPGPACRPGRVVLCSRHDSRVTRARPGLLRLIRRRRANAAAPVAPSPRADLVDDAELDALRGELVRELNKLAERGRRVD